MTNPNANILKQIDIFYGLSNTQLELIAGLCSERMVTAGEIVFPEGAASDELYIIVQGEVSIEVNPALVAGKDEDPLPSRSIATLMRGQCFGEIALVDRGVRSATARSTQDDTRLLVLPSSSLITLCETYPELGYRLMLNLAADMALKIRNVGLLLREKLIYGKRAG